MKIIKLKQSFHGRIIRDIIIDIKRKFDILKIEGGIIENKKPPIFIDGYFLYDIIVFFYDPCFLNLKFSVNHQITNSRTV